MQPERGGSAERNDTSHQCSVRLTLRHIGRMRFPKLSLTEAIGAFMEAAYGKRLDFEHA